MVKHERYKKSKQYNEMKQYDQYKGFFFPEANDPNDKWDVFAMKIDTIKEALLKCNAIASVLMPLYYRGKLTDRELIEASEDVQRLSKSGPGFEYSKGMEKFIEILRSGYVTLDIINENLVISFTKRENSLINEFLSLSDEEINELESVWRR